MNNNGLHWRIAAFDALTVHELHDVLRLRTDVFVVEQNCAYAEVDGADPTALHVMGRTTDGALAAYARVLAPGSDGLPHIGRVVVHPDHRGAQHARQCMQQALDAVIRTYGSPRCALSAQAHLEGFYASLGFQATSAVYPLDGIPHIDMRKDHG
ncbi:MAG TPA: GNAT family N-acetyltransferase [Flavobacteriales bacterium]